jgi:hypothetical protein
MIKRDISIDWDWTKKSLLKKERIASGAGSAIFDSACEMVNKAKGLAEPKAAIVKKAPLSFNEETIKLAGGIEFSGKIISSHLKGAHHIYFFLVTIGSSLEDEASLLMKKGESLSGYLLDRIGSFAVESLADKAEALLRNKYEPGGRSVSMRFSPGYCDWPIEEQVKLDMLLDFSKIGVRLTGSHMMVPRKSVSGIIGIGPKGLFSKSRSQCAICNMKDCGYRRD